MAKVTYLKLKLENNIEPEILNWKGLEIEVKQYLPVAQKLELISNVINLSADDNNFANPLKIDIYLNLQLIKYYTNITFTEKQLENPAKLFDSFIVSGFAEVLKRAIPESELNYLSNGVKESVDAVYKYRNSFLGMMDIMKNDYSNLNFDASEIQQKIADPNNISLLKEVLSKLG